MAGTRILFLQDNGINESLAIAELSASLRRRGHDCRLLLADEERRLAARMQEYAPHLVIIPCNVFASQWVHQAVSQVRLALPGVPVLVGGTHPTFAPDFIAEADIDYQLVGEADLAVPELADRLAAGAGTDSVAGIWTKRAGRITETGVAPRLADLNELPLPDRALYFGYPFIRDLPWKKFSTARGCENRCSFCYNEFIQQLYRDGCAAVRRKTPARVVEEVQAVRELSALRWVHFSDDLFVNDREWLREFAAVYSRGVGLPFSCNSSADRMDEEVARLLAGAGCRMVAMGVETADEALRVRLLRKPSTDAVLRRAAAAVRGAGMDLLTFVMVALPGERPADSLATLRFSRELGATATRVLMAFPLPGTAMARDAAERGQVDVRAASDFNARIDLSVNPYGPYYDVPEPHTFENLAPLLTRLPTASALAVARWLPRRLTRPGRLWMSWQEKRHTGLRIAEGLRYYLHVGNPMARTTNYVSLI